MGGQRWPSRDAETAEENTAILGVHPWTQIRPNVKAVPPPVVVVVVVVVEVAAEPGRPHDSNRPVANKPINKANGETRKWAEPHGVRRETARGVEYVPCRQRLVPGI